MPDGKAGADARGDAAFGQGVPAVVVALSLVETGAGLLDAGVLLVGLELDEHLALRHGLAVAEAHGGDQLGGVGGDDHRLAALGDAENLDAVGEGALRGDDLRDGRGASPAARAGGFGSLLAGH